MEKQPLLPAVKWAGGKRKLVGAITDRIPANYQTYIEPFLGGGALLFALQPDKAIVNDLNKELINVYQVIKDSPFKLLELLEFHSQHHSSDHYYKVRSLDRTAEYPTLNNIEKAARFIYLNKTGYNGLYRVNKKGQNNVPFGRYKNPNIANEKNILSLSKYLNESQIEFNTIDYKDVLSKAITGDFVYLDPPYAPLSSTSSFTSYTSEGFDLEKQIELRDQCLELRERNIAFIQSNSYTPLIEELYSDFRIELVTTNRAINSKSSQRGRIHEVLIYS